MSIVQNDENVDTYRATRGSAPVSIVENDENVDTERSSAGRRPFSFVKLTKSVVCSVHQTVKSVETDDIHAHTPCVTGLNRSKRPTHAHTDRETRR